MKRADSLTNWRVVFFKQMKYSGHHHHQLFGDEQVLWFCYMSIQLADLLTPISNEDTFLHDFLEILKLMLQKF